MKNVMKASRRLFFLRYWNTLTIAYIQRKVALLSKSSDTIFLTPVRPRGCGGHIDRYYHFIFDLAFPLYLLIEKTPSNVIFVVKEFGGNSERLQHMFPNRLKVENKNDVWSADEKTIKLIGMNPKGVLLKSNMYENFKSYIFNNFAIEQDKKRNKVLLIERISPAPQFLAEATGSGSLRRSIINHAELASEMESMVQEPYEFHNLRLENVSFREQLQLFDSAMVVVGQHGAGLSNGVWMQPKSILLELNHIDNVTHFQMISKAKELQYRMYKTSDAHAEIDINDFVNWIMNNEQLKDIFQR